MPKDTRMRTGRGNDAAGRPGPAPICLRYLLRCAVVVALSAAATATIASTTSAAATATITSTTAAASTASRSSAAAAARAPVDDPPPRLAGCDVFPSDSIWNTRVDHLPAHPLSDTFVDTIGATDTLHPDFGSGFWPPGSNSPIGIPFVDVPGDQPLVPVTFVFDDESDPGPYPIPPDAPIEGGPDSTGDRHVLVVDRDACVLYELFDAHPQSDGSWTAGSGAVFDFGSHALRPAGWTSADAAGLPILPGLVRYDEVAAGEIHHAIRFTVPETRREFVWPARHFASSLTESRYPPMGQRFRLKAGFDTSGFSPEVRVILRALKLYGMILADNGSAWFLSGAPDDRWDNDVLAELGQIQGSNFEAVDGTLLRVHPDSGRARDGFRMFVAGVMAGAGWPGAPGMP